MLKKILARTSYLVTMLAMGFAIYYFFLNGSQLDTAIAQNSPLKDYEKLSTQALFKAVLPNENGINQALSQYKGKIIVLNFWATWCSPCREEMPELSQLHAEYQDKNVTVLGIAIDEQNQVKMFMQATPVNYPLVVSEEEGMVLSSRLGNDKDILPYTIIIDTKGKVVKTYFGRISKLALVATLNTLLSH